jgi:5-amino-6-(5-phosphoribosylamino)uracil reductase
VRLLHPEVRDLAPEDLFDLYDLPGPHLRAGFVASVDGVVAVDGRSASLGGPADKAVFRALRAVSDAIIVGAGTVRAEDYGPVRYGEQARTWRQAHGRSGQPPVVIVSRRGQLDPAAKVLQGPVILAVPEGVEVPRDVQVDIIRATDPVALRRSLHERGLSRLLCEGGPSLLTALLAAGVVDELCLTTAASLVGTGPRLLSGAAAARLALRSLVVDDPGVLLARWSVIRSDS